MEDEGAELLREAAWDLYGVPSADFVGARTAWVKRLRGEGHLDLAKAVGALRKPSVAAAAVNALVRAQDPVVQRLRDVGSALRHAQSALDATGLATLRGERDDLLADWVGATRAHAAGGALTAGVEAEVRSTAVAALADAGATEAVLSGTLTRSLAYSGFGEVDVADAVARTSTGVVLTRIEGGRSAGSAKATGVAGETGETGETDEEGVPTDEEADDDVDDADDVDEAALERLRDSLEAAEAEVTQARARRRETSAAQERAGAGVSVAERGLEQARRLLTQAERHLAEATRAQDEAMRALTDADSALARARERRDAAREALEEAEDA